MAMTKRIKLRTLLAGGIFTLLFFGLIVRIYWVQVVKADFWTEEAMKTWNTSNTIRQERGRLLDRDGKVLAGDEVAYTIAVNPKRIAELEAKHPEWKLTDRMVSKLHNVLGTSESKLREIVAAKKEDGTYLSQREVRPDGWKVDKAIKDRLEVFREEIRKLTGVKGDVGLYFNEEQKRYYPNGTLASHILGYEDKDGIAITGLEKKLNEELSGAPGFIKYQKDGARVQLPNGEVEYKQELDGKDVTLTIDKDIQFYIEEAMRTAFEKYKPISITAIAADPDTMEILGMASMPDYNPNTYWNFKDQNSFRNNAIQSVYEPGSTFKIVTLAAAVEEGLFDPNAYYKSGSIKYTQKDKPVKDHNGGRGWGENGMITYLEGLKHSSNVAFVKLGYEMLGKEKLIKYINDFGFGQKTGIELPNEVSRPYSLDYPSEVATATFGQGKVLVTPIQQVAAVAAVANGGKLMQPQIVKMISDPNTGEKKVTEPKVIRQVISADSSRKVGEYLETVVSDQEIGTGRVAFIPGYRIAGKTGTAQKVTKNVKEEGYSKDRYVVSFIGYAPVEKPKVVLYVVVDEPQIDNAGGGAVAGPIFKEIMGKSLLHLGIKPNLTDEEKESQSESQSASTTTTKKGEVTMTLPDVTGMTVAQARQQLKEHSFKVDVLGKGSKVLQQLPKGGGVLPASQKIYLLTDETQGNVPDLKGMSLRDALEMCSLLKVVCTVEGQGYVTSQKAVKIDGKWILQIKLSPQGQANQSTAQSTEAPPKE
ncbi:penicillin-binding transpeptidase domain-containing protein [Cohnella sp. WQ 127256]|uniref:penicillin-binding transpeptidase domain-containing protein n=1 Tax=Cohnella sp. WQ 127256 TaxID=2938790 RepID=UPI0021191FDF|nr:penicillin-binding transpeptidase domain-containing protein [Cohnella sp. WQ 127256]